MRVKGGIPEDFSIVTTFRTKKKDTRGYLFTLYSSRTAREILGLEVSSSPQFIYEDQNDQPGKHKSPRFSVNMADGQ